MTSISELFEELQAGNSEYLPGLSLSGDNYCTSGYCVCAGDAHSETYIPYDPAAESSIETEHYADMHYRYVDESGYGTGEYYDYYDFFEYTDGMLVYYPLYYAFTGNGPPRTYR